MIRSPPVFEFSGLPLQALWQGCLSTLGKVIKKTTGGKKKESTQHFIGQPVERILRGRRDSAEMVVWTSRVDTRWMVSFSLTTARCGTMAFGFPARGPRGNLACCSVSGR